MKQLSTNMVRSNSLRRVVPVVTVVAGLAIAVMLGYVRPKAEKGWIAFGTSGSGLNQFAGPAGIFVNAAGQIFVTDARNARLVRVDDMIGRGWTTLGTRGSGINQFSFPFGIFVTPDGRIFVSDIDRIVQMDDMTGLGWATFGTRGKGVYQFSGLAGISGNSAGQIFVADLGNHRIVRINDMAGTGWTTFGAYGRGVNQFNRPSSIFVSATGQIFVADSGNHRVIRIDDMSGAGWTTFDTHTFAGGIRRLWSPPSVFVNAVGQIFMTDLGNNRIVRINDMAGMHGTAFGTGTSGYNQLSGWASIFVTAAGKLFVADYGNNRIMHAASPPPAEQPSGGRPRLTTPPAPGPQRAIPLSETNPVAGQDEAKGIYRGPLGDFLVGRDQPSSFPPCPQPASRTQNYRTSELYSPAFGENLEVYACANGKIILIEVDYGGPGRAYFVGPASVPYEAPLDRLMLLNVAGKPAIAQLPTPGLEGTLRLAVIERFPSGDTPGILAWIDNTRLSLEDARALMARIMGVRP